MTHHNLPAPCLCTVWQHCVSVGQKVSAGSDIVSVESMKLELPVSATVSGTVTYLKPMGEPAEEGETVATIESDD